MKSILTLIGPYLALVALVLIGSSIFTVDRRELAILVRLSNIVAADFAPGLHFKFPIIDTVYKFDARLLNIDAEPARFLTSEKKDVIVDAFVRWRVDNVADYFRATRGDERRAGELIFQRVNAALREEFAKRTVKQVVSDERGALMQDVTNTVNAKVAELGARVVDVRVKRIDLPAEVSSSVYLRMRAEREQAARALRSAGSKQAEKIRAEADRERTVILATAFREAETKRGEGDAKAAAIYAGAYAADAAFYQLYRSLSAYRTSFATGNNLLMLDARSHFFRYLNSAAPAESGE